MRAADDFEAIRNRVIELQKSPQLVEVRHEFNLAGWCTKCNLHRFHTPAVPVCTVKD